jgi:hypothetical protein
MDVPTKESFSSLPVHQQIAQLERVDAKTRQALILSSRQSVELTRALSAEMLFYTLKEIGLAESTDLLALASPTQVCHMLDLDCWRKDRLDDRKVLTWLMLLDEAGSGKLAEWFLRADIEVLILLVKRHLEVIRKSDIEEDPDFDQSRYFTFDDHYLLRFVGQEEPILSLLLERLRVLDYRTYQTILESSLFALDSNLEEEALRWRNARLADRGYPSYDEAGELFRFVAPESLSLARYRRAALSQVRFAADEELVPPDHALMLLDVRDSFLVRVLATLPPEDREPIRHELAILTNQVVVAEAHDLGKLVEVRRCAELVHDYVNIGVASLAKNRELEAAQLLHEFMLRPFFQVGVSLTLALQQRVRHLDMVFRQKGIETWETYLDSPFQETCIGVRRRLPLFFRGLETPGEILYQRFRDLAEVNHVDAVLSWIPVWFAVMQRWELLPGGRIPEGVTLGVLWNTAFARWVIANQVNVQPLSRDELGALQKQLREPLIEEKNAEFLTLITTQSNLTDEERAALHVLATHAREKLTEALSVAVATTDLRFIEGLLFSLSPSGRGSG